MPPDWLVPGPFPHEVESEERCRITELLNDPACPEVSLALARVDPGITTRLHRLDGIVERYVVLSGEGRVEIDDAAWPVRPGDRVLIAAGLPQRITNTGAGELAFHCICTPRFDPARYTDLDERGPT
jgi:mannose-6-phosphate isomerase-like protein (cupin superfamily)